MDFKIAPFVLSNLLLRKRVASSPNASCCFRSSHLPLLNRRLHAYRYLPVSDPSLYPFFSRKVRNCILVPIPTTSALSNVVITSLMQSSLASAHFAKRVLITNDCLIDFSLSRNISYLVVLNHAQATKHTKVGPIVPSVIAEAIVSTHLRLTCDEPQNCSLVGRTTWWLLAIAVGALPLRRVVVQP